MLQEYGKFCKFSDSLLARASKLADLVAALETSFQESGKDPESAEASRVKKPLDYHCNLLNHVSLHPRCVKALEDSQEILEKQYECCETLKVDASELKTNQKLSEFAINESLDGAFSMHAHMMRNIVNVSSLDF